MSKFVIGFHKMVTDDTGDKRVSPWPSFFDTQEYDDIDEAIAAKGERTAVLEQENELARRYVPLVWDADEIARQ